MAKSPTPESPTETDDGSFEDSFYEVPPELDEPAPPPSPPPSRARSPVPADSEEPDEPVATHAAPRFPFEKVAIGVGAVLVLGIGLAWFRAESRAKAVRQGVAQAEELMLLDTAEGLRRAADLLEPLAKLDPLEAGSARAFALAMLASDYNDPSAEVNARELLVVPSRADVVPRYASLAFGALALGRNALGDAQVELRKAAELEREAEGRGAPLIPWSQALQARVSLRAGALESAVEYATGAAAVPGFAAGLAVHGDAARRAKRDDRTARAAYEAALAASPIHPRAAYGLAKLALAGQVPELKTRARDALGRILASGATPPRERGRAALHLAALRLRDGDAIEVVRGDLPAGLDEKAQDWLMGAARALAANRGPYRAVVGPPAMLESASDDDPKELHPRAPEPPPPPPQVAAPPPPPKPVPAKTTRPAKAAPKKAPHKVAPSRSKSTSAKKAKATAGTASAKKAPLKKTSVKKPVSKKRR